MNSNAGFAARRRARGQSLVEFAFIAPILFFVLMLSLDLGRVVMVQAALNESVRNAARVASLTTGDLGSDESNWLARYDEIRATATGGWTDTFGSWTGVDLGTNDILGRPDRPCPDVGLPEDPVAAGRCFYPDRPEFGSLGCPACTVWVEATVNVDPLTPGLQAIFPAGFTISARTETHRQP